MRSAVGLEIRSDYTGFAGTGIFYGGRLVGLNLHGSLIGIAGIDATVEYAGSSKSGVIGPNLQANG